ncbi:MAG: YHS domain-containing protein [Pseudomonadota bacterium]
MIDQDRKQVVDPVCQTVLDPARTVRTSVYQGRGYYFCSPACQKEFEAAPSKFSRRRGALGRFLACLERANWIEFGPKGPGRR